MTSVLSHALTPDGQPAPEFGYHPAGGCPVYQVPGSSARVYLLRTWASVLAALRDPRIRDLRAVTPDHALAGVTLQRPGGLLRLTSPDADLLRAVLNPVWRRGACEEYRPALRHLAACRAAVATGSGGGSMDWIASFITPYTHDLIMLAAGLATSVEAADLAALSDRTTGTLIREPADHKPVLAAWDELYDYTAALLARWQAGPARMPDSPVAGALRAAGLPPAGPSLAARSAAALTAAGIPPDAVHEAITTILNGIPTTAPALTRITTQLFDRPDMLAACQDSPAAVAPVIREAMRRSAHFTFGLPGIAQAPVVLDGTAIPAGAAVLPVIHAAEHDAVHTPDPRQFRLHRTRLATLAWGAGTHICLGRHLAAIALEEAVTALARTGLRPAGGAHEWQPGTLPVPRLLGARP